MKIDISKGRNEYKIMTNLLYKEKEEIYIFKRILLT